MDFSELKKFPWNDEIYLARQGDTASVVKTCEHAEPIVSQFGKVSYFTDWLGKDEVRSIASLALVEFIMSYPGGVPDEEIPALIKQAIKCDLINSVHRAEYRRSKEEAPPPGPDTGSPRGEESIAAPSGSPQWDPEACLLQNAYARKVQDAVRRLNRKEQTVIRSWYFRQETTEEIAANLGYTASHVRKIRHRALRHLRQLLDRQAV